MKTKKLLFYNLWVALLLVSCQQETTTTPTVSYNDSIYSLKQYKVQRDPTLVRNGFGIDIYHEGNSSLDTLYLKSANSTFGYDLLFYNEMAYAPLANGDYSGSGYPVIFMYTDTLNVSKTVSAALVGQGVTYFNSFTKDSITAKQIAKLKPDPYINLTKYRTEIHTTKTNGSMLLQTTATTLYNSLMIGHKFRPNIGGVFNITDVSAEAQIDLQPVFLIKTREGLYAKFMVTRFKGVGNDTQKLSLQWQAIK